MDVSREEHNFFACLFNNQYYVKLKLSLVNVDKKICLKNFFVQHTGYLNKSWVFKDFSYYVRISK